MTDKNNTAKFITVEGIEGVGKSTCVKYLHDCLMKAGVKHVVTREPGGTEIAEAIRKVLLEHYHETMQNDTELFLMFASRIQHIAKIIKPALARGEWVLCDRFTDASFAYQGGGRGIPLEKIAQLERWVQGDWQPDLTILLTAPVEIALERARRRRTPDRIEKEEKMFFRHAQQIYLDRAAQYPKRFIIIKTNQALSKVKQQLKQLLLEKFEVI